MRKKLLILFILAIIFADGFAQRLIPRTGVTTSWISFDDESVDRLSKFGFTVGLGYEIQLKKNLYVVPEVDLTQKGTDFNYGADEKINLTLYYIDVPVLIKFHPTKNFYLIGGPALGIGIDGRYKNVEPFDVDEFNVKFKPWPKNEYDQQKFFTYVDNRMDLGFQLGAGVEIFDHITIDLRYVHGLTSIYSTRNRENDDAAYPIEMLEKAKNRVFQLSIGLPIQINKKQKEKASSFTSRVIPRVGLTMSTINYNFGKSPEPKIGFTLGAGFEMGFGKVYCLQPEINFIQKGSQWSWDGTDQSITLHYIEIPLLSKFKIGPEKTQFNILIGPSIGFGVGGKYKVGAEELDVKFEPFPPDGTQEDYFRYIDNPIDLGAQAGLGIELFGKATIDVRYTLGLNNLYDGDIDRGISEMSSIRNVQNRGWQFSVGVPINFKKK